MLDTLGTICSGGITGLLGTALQGIGEYFRRRQSFRQELELRRLDMAMMDKEWEYRDRIACREGDLRLQQSSDALRQSSYDHDQATYSQRLAIHSVALKGTLVFVDVVRGLIRPTLTLLLCVLMWQTLVQAGEVLELAGISGLEPAAALRIYRDIVTTALYVAVTAIVWWFGGRSNAIRGNTK